MARPLQQITESDREAFFEEYGFFGSESQIADALLGLSPADFPVKKSHNTDGGKTSFYDVADCKDVDDIAEHWNLRGDEFNCLKAIAGIALGARHPGTSPKRDANKLLHYAKRIVARLEKQDGN